MSDHLAQLRDGVAVITGAGSGIGEGLARYAAELGMKVVLADIAADPARPLADRHRRARASEGLVKPAATWSLAWWSVSRWSCWWSVVADVGP